MKGTLFKHHGIWYVIVDLQTEGKRKQKWVNTGTANKKEAEKILPRIVMAAQENELPEDDTLTVAQFMDKWLRMYAKPHVKPNTYYSYEIQTETHIKPTIGRTKLTKLKPMDIQEMYMKKMDEGLSNTSVRYIHTVLKLALNHAVKWRLLAKNPCNDVEPPKKDKFTAIAYTADQLKRLLEIMQGSSIYLAVEIAVNCGLRRGEICGLRWQDVNLDTKELHVAHSLSRTNKKLQLSEVKTDKSERNVALPDGTLQLLKHEKTAQEERGHGKATDYVIAWDDGSPYDPTYVYHRFKKNIEQFNKLVDDNDKLDDKTKEETKLPVIRFHDLRHSHATLLLAEGVPIKVVSERLGHSTTSFTQDTYQHVLPSMQKEAAALIDKALGTESPEHEPLWHVLQAHYDIEESEARQLETELDRLRTNICGK